jgi:putative redox protein
MSLTATARAIPGTLRQEILIGGEHRLITDQPEELGGEGSGPSPHELFPAALAACVTVTLVQYGRTKGWDLGGVTVDVDYDNSVTPRRIEIVIHVDGDLSGEQLGAPAEGGARLPVAPLGRSGIRVQRTARDLVKGGAR